MKKIIIILLVTFLSVSSYAKVKLPAIINNGMVLQQKAKAVLWGTAKPLTDVLINTGWDNKQYVVKSDATGNWRTKVSTPQAGGPYKIIFNDGDGEPVTLNDILIGEVWVCSGQSNMEMPMKGFNKQPIKDAAQIIADAQNHPDIRVFRVPKIVSAVPLNDCKGQWFITDSQTVKNFSAIAYQYAKFLHDKLNVPIGIVATYWGGTAIQSWMDEETLRKVSGVIIPGRLDTILDPEKKPEESPCILYNSMVKPIAGYTIKGFVWYQGESNRYNPALYEKLMPVMVNEWRTLWDQGKLPFYYVQIAPFGYSGPNNYFSAFLREVQLKELSKIPNSGMIVTIDAGKQKFIHPPDKTIVSKRLATLSLDKTYHLPGIKYELALYQSAQFKNGHADLNFSHTAGGLILKDDSLKNFEIAGSDKVFYPANAVIINKNKVRVSADQVKQPVAVRYAFKNWVDGNLFNGNGQPVSSFRTDSW